MDGSVALHPIVVAWSQRLLPNCMHVLTRHPFRTQTRPMHNGVSVAHPESCPPQRLHQVVFGCEVGGAAILELHRAGVIRNGFAFSGPQIIGPQSSHHQMTSRPQNPEGLRHGSLSSIRRQVPRAMDVHDARKGTIRERQNRCIGEDSPHAPHRMPCDVDAHHVARIRSAQRPQQLAVATAQLQHRPIAEPGTQWFQVPLAAPRRFVVPVEPIPRVGCATHEPCERMA